MKLIEASAGPGHAIVVCFVPNGFDAVAPPPAASDSEEPDPSRERLPARCAGGGHRRLRRALQSPALPREPRKPHTGRRLVRQGRDNPQEAKGDQSTDHRKAPLAASSVPGIGCNSKGPEPPLIMWPACSSSSAYGQSVRPGSAALARASPHPPRGQIVGLVVFERGVVGDGAPVQLEAAQLHLLQQRHALAPENTRTFSAQHRA